MEFLYKKTNRDQVKSSFMITVSFGAGGDRSFVDDEEKRQYFIPILTQPSGICHRCLQLV